MSGRKKAISSEQKTQILETLAKRFEDNQQRHPGIAWEDVQTRLEANPEKLWSLNEMERTGGEPDVIAFDSATGAFVFYDCCAETPAERRNLCYDRAALEARKKYKPENSALDMAAEMGIELLTEDEYCMLQEVGHFDSKTSSWLKTPEDVRERGGAIFGDYRYGRVFIYHNGADSYYAARGFRGSLRV